MARSATPWLLIDWQLSQRLCIFIFHSVLPSTSSTMNSCTRNTVWTSWRWRLRSNWPNHQNSTNLDLLLQPCQLSTNNSKTFCNFIWKKWSSSPYRWSRRVFLLEGMLWYRIGRRIGTYTGRKVLLGGRAWYDIFSSWCARGIIAQFRKLRRWR